LAGVADVDAEGVPATFLLSVALWLAVATLVWLLLFD
jgi:hypothetical protein